MSSQLNKDVSADGGKELDQMSLHRSSQIYRFQEFQTVDSQQSNNVSRPEEQRDLPWLAA